MITPFLTFSGQCSAALDFYEKVFHGTEKKIQRFGDLTPDPRNPIPEEYRDYILHAELKIQDTTFWFFDSPEKTYPGSIVNLQVTYPSVTEVEAVFAQLAEEGEILIPLAPQFFSPMHGAVRDRFGVSWQVRCQ